MRKMQVKRIAKLFCLIVGVVLLGVLKNKELPVCAEEDAVLTYSYKGVTYGYINTMEGVEIKGADSTFSKEKLKLPQEINGRPVTSIGSRAFGGWCYLEEIELPESLERIEAFAFYCCEGLSNVEIPDGVTSIGKKAFYACGLDSIILPESIESIGAFAFDESYRLYVVLPDKNVAIGTEAFGEKPNVHVHQFENGEISREERCYIMEKEGKPLKCLKCDFETSHRFVDGETIGGSKLVAPLIIEGKCSVCGVFVRWNDWSYAWVTDIVAVVLLGFVIAIINYMRRMKKG